MFQEFGEQISIKYQIPKKSEVPTCLPTTWLQISVTKSPDSKLSVHGQDVKTELK